MTGTVSVSWNAPARAAGTLLLLLGSLKWLSAALAWGTLGRRSDPVLGLPENWVMLVTGLIEWAGLGSCSGRGVRSGTRPGSWSCWA